MTVHDSDLIDPVTAEQHDPARYLIELAGDIMEALECGDTEAARLIHGGPVRGPKDLTLEALNDYQALARGINPFTNATVDISRPGDAEHIAAVLTAATGVQLAEQDFESGPSVLASVRTEHTRTYSDGRARALTDTERCWQARRIIGQALVNLARPDASIDVPAIGL